MFTLYCLSFFVATKYEYEDVYPWDKYVNVSWSLMLNGFSSYHEKNCCLVKSLFSSISVLDLHKSLLPFQFFNVNSSLLNIILYIPFFKARTSFYDSTVSYWTTRKYNSKCKYFTKKCSKYYFLPNWLHLEFSIEIHWKTMFY